MSNNIGAAELLDINAKTVTYFDNTGNSLQSLGDSCKKIADLLYWPNEATAMRLSSSFNSLGDALFQCRDTAIECSNDIINDINSYAEKSIENEEKTAEKIESGTEDVKTDYTSGESTGIHHGINQPTDNTSNVHNRPRPRKRNITEGGTGVQIGEAIGSDQPVGGRRERVF